MGAARGTAGPGHVGRPACAGSSPGACAVVGSARCRAAAAGSACTGPDLGHAGGAASRTGSGRPHLGSACRASRRRRGSRLAADRRPGTRLGRARAGSPRRAIVADAFRPGLGSACSCAGARVGSSRRTGSGVGRAAASACGTAGRALATWHARRPRVGYAGARVARQHAFRSVMEPAGRSRVGRREARGFRPRRARGRSRFERLGSCRRERSTVAPHCGAVLGCRGGFGFEPSCAGVERTGGSGVGRA